MPRQGTCMTPAWSIRAVVAGLGMLSVLIASALAGFGLLGMEHQLEVRRQVVAIERALGNHNSADAFMDSALHRHAAAIENARAASTARARTRSAASCSTISPCSPPASPATCSSPLPAGYAAELRDHRWHAPILQRWGTASRRAGADRPGRRIEQLRTSLRERFTVLEQQMDEARDRVQSSLDQVRDTASRTALRGKRMIRASLLAGIMLLVLITAIAIRVAQRITADLAGSREQAHRLALHDRLPGCPTAPSSLNASNRTSPMRGARDHARDALPRPRPLQAGQRHVGPPGRRWLLRASPRGCGTACAGRHRGPARRRRVRRRPGPLAGGGGRTLASAHHRRPPAPYDLGEHGPIGASIGIALAPADTDHAEAC